MSVNLNDCALCLRLVAWYHEWRRVMAEMRTDRASANVRFFFCNSKNINSNQRNKYVILNCDRPNKSARMGSCNWGRSDDGCQIIDSLKDHQRKRIAQFQKSIFENKFGEDVKWKIFYNSTACWSRVTIKRSTSSVNTWAYKDSSQSVIFLRACTSCTDGRPAKTLLT